MPHLRPSSVLSGHAAEEQVVQHLLASGWVVLARRLRIGHLEVDVLAQKGDVVAIVEIRGRRVSSWVSPMDSVRHGGKRAKLARAARALWASRFASDPSVRTLRIDVASVVYGPQGSHVEIAPGAIDAAQY